MHIIHVHITHTALFSYRSTVECCEPSLVLMLMLVFFAPHKFAQNTHWPKHQLQKLSTFYNLCSQAHTRGPCFFFFFFAFSFLFFIDSDISRNCAVFPQKQPWILEIRGEFSSSVCGENRYNESIESNLMDCWEWCNDYVLRPDVLV